MSLENFTQPIPIPTSSYATLASEEHFPVVSSENSHSTRRDISPPQTEISVQQTPHTRSHISQAITVASTSTLSEEIPQLDRRIPLDQIQDKRCWICFGEDNDSEGAWVRPCRCTLICHEECLLHWIAESQRSTPLKRVRCPQCKTTYHLSESTAPILYILSFLDSKIQASIPYIGIFGASFCVAMGTVDYGAFALLSMVGVEEGERLLQEPWSWRMFFSLPLIPILLIFSRTRIADPLMPLAPLLFIRSDSLTLTMPPHPTVTLSILPWIRMMYNGLYTRLFGRIEASWRREIEPYVPEEGDGANDRGQDVFDRLERRNFGRTIVGALTMPFISALFGSFLGKSSFIRSKIPDHFHRSILCGCLIVILKDAVDLTFKYQKVKQRRSRQVQNYEEFAHEERTRRGHNQRRRA
ncbi:12009_t:CDS:2 [Ambispora gerdemannii]|uniref:12009_t:CDS:1 n=1 Tax=Ambispora gerdemannii TaxID=144530 RepID=A0A9N8Z4U0_9GLOM|nr:12009_t:CDS:2 [Ambispora gerdemannii]